MLVHILNNRKQSENRITNELKNLPTTRLDTITNDFEKGVELSNKLNVRCFNGEPR